MSHGLAAGPCVNAGVFQELLDDGNEVLKYTFPIPVLNLSCQYVFPPPVITDEDRIRKGDVPIPGFSEQPVRRDLLFEDAYKFIVKARP